MPGLIHGAALAGGLAQGLSGTGFGMITVPILSMLLGPKVVPPVILLITSAINLCMLLMLRAHVQWRRAMPLAIGGLAGVPFGTLLLLLMPPAGLKILIGIAVAGTALLMLSGIRWPIRNERAALFPVGFASGMLSGSIMVGGPPVILFLQNQQWDKTAFRANIMLLWNVQAMTAYVTYFAAGLITRSAGMAALALAPAMLIGLLSGFWLHHRLPEARFSQFVLALALISGSMALYSGIIASL